MTIPAVLWDVDGVLINSRPFHLQAWRRLCRDLGIPYDDAYFRGTFGLRNDAILAPLLPGRSQAELLQLGQRKEAHLRALAAGRLQPLPGVVPLVRDLHRAGHSQAIVSSTAHENIDLVLGELEIQGCFQAIVGEEDVSRGKPDPQIMLTAAERLRVPPADCVVIEDAPAGVEAAASAGMRAIAVTTTRTADELSRADLVVDSLEDARVRPFLRHP